MNMDRGVTEASSAHKRRFEHLRGNRGCEEAHWREVSQFVYPEADDFFTDSTTRTKGERRHTRIYDSTAMLSLQKFASLVESLVVPRNSRWHNMVMNDATVMRNKEAQQWLADTTATLFRHRYDPRANFQGQFSENLMSIGAFGNGAFFTDRDQKRKGFRYKAIFLGDVYFDVDFQGVLDTVYRRFDLSHKQAIQQFGDKVPEIVKKNVGEKPDERNQYIHVVCPNDDLSPGKPGPSGMAFKSIYLHLDTGVELEAGGYRTNPYSVGRYQTSPHEVLGRGPAMSILPDIRTLSEMGRADLRATHKLVDPPLLAHDDGVIGSGRQQIYLDPGMVSMGGVSADGRQLIQPLQTGARVDLNEAKMEQKRNVIREAFLVDLFRLHQETKRMTATESMMRNQDRGAQAGPIMGRLQSEQLSAIIERELDIAMESELIPPPPQIIQEALAEGEYDITFESPLSRMQRAENLIGIDMLIQQGVTLANAGMPEALKTIDGLEIMRLTADGGGAPPSVVLSKEAYEAKIQGEQAQAQAQQQLESAPAAASAMKDLAQAEQIQRGG